MKPHRHSSYLFLVSSFLLLVSCYLFLVSPILAINPIIIKKAKFGAPPSSSKLSDDGWWWGNEASLTCKGKYSISQTFEPISNTTTDANGNQTTTYVTQDITEISGKPPSVTGLWSNPAAWDAFGHLARNVNQELVVSPDKDNDSLLSYNPDSDVGSLGAASRSLPDSVQSCLVGQRLVKAVMLANGSGAGYYTNEQIAWDEGGRYLPNKTQDKGKKVQLDDIAIAMSENPYLSLTDTDSRGRALPSSEPNYVFYNPEDDCYINDPEKPTPTPAPLSQFTDPTSDSYDPIPPSDAVALYKTLSPVGGGPSTRRYKTWSEDRFTGSIYNVETKNTNMPRGEVFSTTAKLAVMVKPEEQTLINVNACFRGKSNNIQDKPNPVFPGLQAVKDAFGQVIDQARSFSADLGYEFHLDATQQTGISTEETALRDYLPQDEIDNSCLADPAPAYSTAGNKVSFDVGNPCYRTVFTNNLLPDAGL